MRVHSSGSAPGPGGDKRTRILDAAEQVFAESGFFSARVSEIARRAGVADGTIYLYFKSKDELLMSLFESRMEWVHEQMTRAVAGATTSVDKLMAIIRTHLTIARDHPQVAEVLTIELRQSARFMKEAPNPRFGEFLKAMATVIADGQASGELAADVPAPHAARMIFGIIDELVLAWLLGRGERFDIERAADWAGALIMNGLRPRTPSRSGSEEP